MSHSFKKIKLIQNHSILFLFVFFFADTKKKNYFLLLFIKPDDKNLVQIANKFYDMIFIITQEILFIM